MRGDEGTAYLLQQFWVIHIISPYLSRARFGAFFAAPRPNWLHACSISKSIAVLFLAKSSGIPSPSRFARIIGYTSNFQGQVQRPGHIPPDILRIKPRWPSEAVAMRLTTEIIRETLAPPAPPEQA